MFPGMNMNSAQMRQAMKKMGMAQEELSAVKVVITLEDKELVFNQPSVAKVKMMGQETFQLSGSYEERSLDSVPEIQESDIETVMSQANVPKEKALEAIKAAKGDLAQAIMDLTQ